MSTIQERILEGIRSGIERHWDYQKSVLDVKPEYLFTVSVADSLTDGFNGNHGIDLKIYLEYPVHRIAAQGLINFVGLKNYFLSVREKINRRGKVDIFVEPDSQKNLYVVELKGFDPSATEVKKEVARFISFLGIYSAKTSIKSCHLAFPSKCDRGLWIAKQLRNSSIPDSLQYTVEKRGIHTNEDPEDGIPYYYANVITLERI